MRKLIITVAAIAAFATPAAAQSVNIEQYVRTYIQKTCPDNPGRRSSRARALPGLKSVHRGLSCATDARMRAVSAVYFQNAQRISMMSEIRQTDSEGNPTQLARRLLWLKSENYCAAEVNNSAIVLKVLDFRTAAAIARRNGDCD